jgi:hypothetical protein
LLLSQQPDNTHGIYRAILRITPFSHAMPTEPGSPGTSPDPKPRHSSGRFSLLPKVSAESSIVVATDFHSLAIL